MEEEAQRLVERFGKAIDDDYSEWLEEAKQCAKICVEEMQKVCNGLENWHYLEGIKQEIDKL
jgi:hypothetical protein